MHVDAGLEVVAFPCNQFGDEEPGSNEEIEEFVCTRFKSEFPIFDKVDLGTIDDCYICFPTAYTEYTFRPDKRFFDHMLIYRLCLMTEKCISIFVLPTNLV